MIDLNAVITDINNNQIDQPGQAVTKFQAFLISIKTLGNYSATNWQTPFITKVYEFGTLFKKISPSEFLLLINNEIAQSNNVEREILLFIKSEILFNYENLSSNKDFFTDLVSQYITNPEFRNTLGHILLKEQSFLEAIYNYRLAIKENPKQNFIEAKFNAEVLYIESLIETNDLDTAQNYVNQILVTKEYISSFIFQNWFVFLANRIKDYKISEAKLSKKENEIKVTILKELELERRKTIELLGIFTAIIAFIFSTVSISKSFEFSQSLVFIICLGLILILFCLILSIIFINSNSSILGDRRLYIIILLGVLLYLIPTTASIISEYIKIHLK